MDYNLERRHEDHPHPPPGIAERRACSDRECMEARNRWFTEELLPKLMVRFWVGIATTVVALAGVFMYLSDAAITRFELKAKSLYEAQDTHDKDMTKIEQKLEENRAELSHSMQEIITEIRRVHER